MDKMDKAMLALFVLQPLRAQIEALDAEILKLCAERDQLTRKVTAAEYLLANWVIQPIAQIPVAVPHRQRAVESGDMAGL